MKNDFLSYLTIYTHFEIDRLIAIGMKEYHLKTFDMILEQTGYMILK